MCECLMDGFSHQDKCPIDFSESGHLSFKEQVLAPSLLTRSTLTASACVQLYNILKLHALPIVLALEKKNSTDEKEKIYLLEIY